MTVTKYWSKTSAFMQEFCFFLFSFLRVDVTTEYLFFFLFLQVIGAAWYLLSVDRYTSCWKSICRKEDSSTQCVLRYLDCDTFDLNPRKSWANITKVFESCDPDGDSTFKYGIFASAVKKDVVSSSFIAKYFYCLWWGLQQLR